MQAERVGQYGLDHVAVAADHQVAVRAHVGHLPAHRGHRTDAHVGQSLAVGEHRGRRVGLDHAPELLLRQVLQGPTGPGPVVHLGQVVLHDHLEVTGGGQRRDGLPAAVERRADQPVDAHLGKSIRQSLGLSPAGFVQVDPWGAAGQCATGVRGGSTVPQQYHRRHVAAIQPVLSATIRAAPRAQRYQTNTAMECLATYFRSHATVA